MEPAGIALRLLVYLDSVLMLGMLLFAASWTRQVRSATAVFAAVGIVLTTVTMLRLAASFSDSTAFFDIPMLQMLLTETAIGWAAIARITALLAVVTLALTSAKRFYPILFAIIAVVLLSWNGHGAMTDNALGWLHLAGNAFHLLAGLGWIGALAAAALLPRATAQRGEGAGAGTGEWGWRARGGRLSQAAALRTNDARTRKPSLTDSLHAPKDAARAHPDTLPQRGLGYRRARG